jgi:hypothetical protein
MNNILGLGPNKKPFIYFDDHISTPNWETLHTDISYGIAKSKWHKRYVSAGVHTDWSDLEVTPYIRDYNKWLTPEQQKLFLSLETTEEKIKFMNCALLVSHPFWLIFVRDNKRIERTGIQNKSISADCSWTPDSQYFTQLIQFVNSLPFESIGRVVIFMTEANNQTVPHFDAGTVEQRNSKPHDDFIWFTTRSETKNIYVMDGVTLEKTYASIDRRFVWWNEMDYHGTDPVSHFSFSIRIDGKFLPDIKQRLLNEDH